MTDRREASQHASLGDGVTLIDIAVERPRFAACHPIEHDGEALLRLIDAQVAIGQLQIGRDGTVAALTEALHALWMQEATQRHCTIDGAEAPSLLAIDAELNAKGKLIWLAQPARQG